MPSTLPAVAALFAAPLLAFAAGCSVLRAKDSRHADVVVLGAPVATLVPGGGTAEALAVVGDRIAAVGRKEEVERFVGPKTRVIDCAALGGRLVLPGFIESHGHFLSLGESMVELDLSDARDFGEIVRRVQAAVARAAPGELIRGRGWHQEKWTAPPPEEVEGMPTHEVLSEVSPDNPVLLVHASGHALLANARAMERAGVGPRTPSPPGGEIVRRPGGEPTGVFRENAMDLFASLEASAARPSPRRLMLLAANECLRNGITTFCDAGADVDTIARYDRWAEQGALPLRLYVMVREAPDVLEEALPRIRRIDAHRSFLTVRAIKCMADGALGSHGAWLLEPYRDRPDTTGIPVTPPEEIERTARLALRHGFQLCTHAIGDRANREVLDVYEKVLAGDRTRRWRIEHAQHLHPEDISRFARLGVVASMQPIHCTSDAPFVIERLGEERARTGAYVWRSLLDAGCLIASGTDAPVEDVDPIACFYAAVTRRLPDGTRFFPEQCMTREEAIASYTRDAAWAAFEEDDRGTLEPGKLADLVVLDRDLLTCLEEEIPKARVLLTMVGGRVAYAAENSVSGGP